MTDPGSQRLRQVLILSFGPASVTKAAVRRARRMVGSSGSLVVAAAVPTGQRPANRLAAQAVVVANLVGIGAVHAALELFDPEPILMVHDDVSVTAEVVDRMIESLDDRPLGIAPADHSGGVDPSCLVGTPRHLAALGELVLPRFHRLLPEDQVAVVTGSFRHDERCRTGAPADDQCEKPLVVASMIVRDEEELLPGCLTSLEGFVDHVVICDTGSSDRTVEIAEAAGARVIHRPWNDDFALARNEVLNECRDASYVLWVDADERLECADPGATRAVLATHPPNAETLVVEIENRRSEGPTSVSRAQRLFRPDELMFEGAIHEGLRHTDGSDVSAAYFEGFRLLHLGYDETIAASRDKAVRNLRIARREYQARRTAKTALDYARSCAYAGGHLVEAVAAIEEALEQTGTEDPMRSELLALRADFELRLDLPEQAFDSATRVLDMAPDNDVAAAVYATAASRLGRDTELVATMAQLDRGGNGSAIRVPRNMGTALALASAATARLGDVEEANSFAADALDFLVDEPDRWRTMIEAFAGIDPGVAAAVLSSVSGTELSAVLDAAEHTLPAEHAAIFCARARTHLPSPATSNPPDPDGEVLGITFSFGEGVLPATGQVIADAIPPQRRVVEWSGSGELSDRLSHRSSSFDSLDGSEGAALISRLEAITSNSQGVDVAVGGIRRQDAPEVLTTLRRLIDPSGLIVLWETDENGNAVSLHKAGSAIPTDDTNVIGPELLASCGFMPETPAPASVILARPIWDQQALERSRNDVSSTVRSLIVSSESGLPPELEIAYRASVPGDVALRFGGPAVAPEFRAEDTEGDSDALILVTNPGLVPEPGWVQALWDAASETGAPVGVRVIDQEGFVVHAGASEEGSLIGLGEAATAPIMLTDRDDVVLVEPFVASAADLAGEAPIRGRVLGSIAAMTFDASAASGHGVRLREMFAKTVVLIGGPPPGREDPEELASLDKAFGRLLDAGVTPVYQWEDRSQHPDPYALNLWRRRGVVVFAPSPLRFDATQFSTDTEHARADALVAAFEPLAVVYLSRESLQWDYLSVSGQGAGAPVIYSASFPAGDLAHRLDVICSPGDLADELDAAVRGERPQPVPAVCDIPVVEQVAGLVSVVIPVHNRWDLTEVCLDALRRHTDTTLEIIVVDNGSSDGTAAGLVDADVIVVTNDRNAGFPTAVNQGINASRGEYVCVLNNDTEVTSGWLEAMLSALQIPGTGLVGPRSNQIAGLQSVPGAPRLADRDEAIAWATTWTKSRRDRTWRIMRLIGFCLLARRSTLERLGGFDEGFGIGNFEDDELGNRVMDAGLSLRVADGAIVLHHGSATFKSLQLDTSFIMHRAARHLAGRGDGRAGAVSTVVLSDGNASGAAACAASALQVTDRVRIAERGALASTELAAAAVRGAQVEVVAADWSGDEGAASALAGLDEPMVLVVGSHERIESDDWGWARAELEAFEQLSVEVATPSGSEVRLVRPGDSAVRSVGTRSAHRANGFRLV